MPATSRNWPDLFDLCVRMLAARSPGDVLDQLLDGAISMLGADSGYLVESVGGQLVFRRRWGSRPEVPGEPVSRAIVADALATSVPVVVANASGDPRYALRESVRQFELHSVIAARLGTEENVVLYLESRHTVFGGEHVEWFERLLQLSDAAVERTAERHSLKSARELYERYELSGMVVRDESMVDLLSRAGRLAEASHPVLIQGPTGSGKELVSRFLHHNGPRRDAELIVVNCAALPPELIESTLFGHVRGAFTGASQAEPGMVRRADKGTLVLDEIAELPLSQQAKLLRLIDNGEIQPVGGGSSLEVDVRFVAATHRDLERAVADGHFRADLFYRINVVQLEVPALRERPDDVLPLFEHFLAIDCAKLHIDPPVVDAGAVSKLKEYAWPGNVRELRSVAQRLAIAGQRRVSVDDLRDLRGDQVEEPLEPLVDTERSAIERHLQASNYVLAAAARSLGLSREGLRQKMRRLGIARYG